MLNYKILSEARVPVAGSGPVGVESGENTSTLARFGAITSTAQLRRRFQLEGVGASNNGLTRDMQLVGELKNEIDVLISILSKKNEWMTVTCKQNKTSGSSGRITIETDGVRLGVVGLIDLSVGSVREKAGDPDHYFKVAAQILVIQKTLLKRTSTGCTVFDWVEAGAVTAVESALDEDSPESKEYNVALTLKSLIQGLNRTLSLGVKNEIVIKYTRGATLDSMGTLTLSVGGKIMNREGLIAYVLDKSINTSSSREAIQNVCNAIQDVLGDKTLLAQWFSAEARHLT